MVKQYHLINNMSIVSHWYDIMTDFSKTHFWESNYLEILTNKTFSHEITFLVIRQTIIFINYPLCISMLRPPRFDKQMTIYTRKKKMILANDVSNFHHMDGESGNFVSSASDNDEKQTIWLYEPQ